MRSSDCRVYGLLGACRTPRGKINKGRKTDERKDKTRCAEFYCGPNSEEKLRGSGGKRIKERRRGRKIKMQIRKIKKKAEEEKKRRNW